MDTANITGSTCLTLYRSKDLSYRLFIKVKVLIFVLNYTLLHLQALELEQSLPPLPSHGLQRPVSRTMLHYLS